MKNHWFKKFFAPWRLCVKTKGMEARTCPRCHSQVTYPPPGGTGRCPHCDCLLIGDPTPADLEMLRDDMAGKPLPRKAVVGIADMQARLQQLTQEKSNCSTAYRPARRRTILAGPTCRNSTARSKRPPTAWPNIRCSSRD